MLIAAYHVFHRLSAPRHPPIALNIFLLSQDELLSNPYSIFMSARTTCPLSDEIRFDTNTHLTDLIMEASEMVGLERLELSTSRLSGVRSSHLSYRPAFASAIKMVEAVGIEPTTTSLQS